jgi:hypothetical protein
VIPVAAGHLPGSGHHSRPRSTADEDRRLRVYVDAARRGSKWSAYEAIKLLRATGRFDGLRRQEARRVVAGWLAGCDPDIVAEAWAIFVGSGGLR